MMSVDEGQKLVIQQIINCFETGKKDGDYSAIAIFADGKDGRKQVTYGRCQATEDSGTLKTLLVMYSGQFAPILHTYLDFLIGTGVLYQNSHFLLLLEQAGRDPVMQKAQDQLFDERYYIPALRWAMNNGFTRALSLAVIYDSFIHSGRVPTNIRIMFKERLPVNGGDEKQWIISYVDARNSWLAQANNPLLHNTTYRMRCFKRLIAEDNWNLTKRPIVANGVVLT